ncbi:agrin-like [Elysia marginata]|uniref:Agrin-like n=1 Tax=Elysia marginata TaxID=1093978 RepID=A0AAV4ENR0_9GAST|nr:agrin-like [Elysia marginata]
MWLFLSALLVLVATEFGVCPSAEAIVLNPSGHIARHPRCTDVRIEDATKMAEVVVSGKVVKLMQDEAHSTNQLRMLKGEIEIKRVFKGEEVVDKMADIVPGRLRAHKMVMVEGFGDPVICHNSVKERDTKIFLLKPNGNGELKLNSSVVTLNLRNLDYVDAVVHSEYPKI